MKFGMRKNMPLSFKYMICNKVEVLIFITTYSLQADYSIIKPIYDDADFRTDGLVFDPTGRWIFYVVRKRMVHRTLRPSAFLVSS